MARPKMTSPPAAPAAPAASRYPMVIETFRDPEWSIRNMQRDRPSAINFLSYRRYRITVEEIDEPKEVLVARLQEMWDHADGYRTAERIRNEAARLGAALVGESGAERSALKGKE